MKDKDTQRLLANYCDFIENDIYIITVGFTNFSCVKNPCKSYRFRYNYTIAFVTEGIGTLYINQKKYKIEAGNIFILPKGTKAKFYPYKSNTWKYFWFNFDGNVCEKYLKLMGFSKHNHVISCINNNDIIFQFRVMMDKAKKGIKIGKYQALSAFFSIMDSLIIEQNKTVSNINIFDSILKYINLHYSRSSLSVEEICKYFNISHSYLCKLFKTNSELSAKATILNFRLQESQNLLLKTNLNIKQIAYSVGFSDEVHFSKIFKKEFSISPSEYRKSKLLKKV